MIVYILSYVPFKELVTSVSLVCKKFNQTILEDSLLPTDLEIDFSSYSPMFETQSLKTIKLLNSAKSLRYLTVHVNNHLCAMLEAVGKQSKHLRGLRILYTTGNFISLKEKEECSSHLISIGTNCKQLKELRLLINCSFYSMDLIKQMLIARQNTLKALEIDSYELSSEVFRQIADCDKLEELKLPKFELLSKSCFSKLDKKMSSLKILELCVRKLSDECLAQGLSKCSSLEELTVHQANRLSRNGLHAITNLSTLKKLHVNIRSRGLIKSEHFIHAFCEGQLNSLEYLELSGYLDLSDYGIINIIEKYANLNLKSLILDGCNNVSVQCFLYLYKTYVHLRPLKINGNSFPKDYGEMKNLFCIDQKQKNTPLKDKIDMLKSSWKSIINSTM